MNDRVRADAERILEYSFRDPALLESALTHASIADTRLESNERMEFFGDAVLSMIVCEYLYIEFPDLLEGELTKIKSTVVSRRSCAAIARQIGLDALLHTAKGLGETDELPHSLSAAVFESLLAALYLDGGIAPVRAFVVHHMAEPIRKAAQGGHHENFKSVLQQFAQHNYGTTALYSLLDEKGPDHAKCFEVCVELNGRRFASSWSASKKQAEQEAALNALIELGVAHMDEEEDELTIVPAEQWHLLRAGDEVGLYNPDELDGLE